MRSVHASRAERRRRLPGDELIDQPAGGLTHAITIASRPAQIWPWLVQMGAGRAGWYSYDFIDNGRTPSAWAIKPELQAPKVGTVFPALPGRQDGFTLLTQDRDRSLTLGWLGTDGRPIVTWAFVLDQVGDRATRLIVRARGRKGYRFLGAPQWISVAAARLAHFVMERKQLIGLAQRVERNATRDEHLERFMPEYDVIEQHAIHVEAPAEVTFAAACGLDMQQSRLIRAIIRGRELMMGSRVRAAREPRGLIAATRAMGWGELASVPGREIVMGAVVRPWEPDVTFRTVAPDAFLEFREPGCVKIIWTLRADSNGAGSTARTETRVLATDAEARHRFRPYWRRVRPGVVLIRRALMRQLKRDAERAAHRP